MSQLTYQPGEVQQFTKISEPVQCKLTWAQYRKMLNRAEAYMELSTDPEWRNRWFIVQCRILQAMTNTVIFFR